MSEFGAGILLLKTIKEDLVSFFDQLISILPKESELIIFRLFVKESASIVHVAEYLVKNLIPLEGKVKTRDENYFITNAILFEKIGTYETEVNRFKMLWEISDDPHNKETVWEWLQHFINLGKEYANLPDDCKLLMKNSRK